MVCPPGATGVTWQRLMVLPRTIIMRFSLSISKRTLSLSLLNIFSFEKRHKWIFTQFLSIYDAFESQSYLLGEWCSVSAFHMRKFCFEVITVNWILYLCLWQDWEYNYKHTSCNVSKFSSFLQENMSHLRCRKLSILMNKYLLPTFGIAEIPT